MGKPRKQRPDGIVLYQQSLNVLSLLPDEAAGKAIKAAVAYFTSGSEMEDTQSMEFIAYSILRVDIDNALGRFKEKCERNWRNRHGGEEQPEITDGDQPLPVVTDSDQNRKEFEMNRTENELNRDEQKKEADKPPRAPRFIPPSLSEIEEYCRSRGNTVDAQSFFDFYSSKNWMIGKNKMKDWQAVIRTWERRRDGKKPDIRRPNNYYQETEGSL